MPYVPKNSINLYLGEFYTIRIVYSVVPLGSDDEVIPFKACNKENFSKYFFKRQIKSCLVLKITYLGLQKSKIKL